MTVQNTTVKDIYVGNGATTKFPITFQMTDHPESVSYTHLTLPTIA